MRATVPLDGGLSKVTIDQRIHHTLQRHYDTERALRQEAVNELKEERRRLIQLQEELRQNQRIRPDPTEGIREDVRMAQHEAAKASLPPPPPPSHAEKRVR